METRRQVGIGKLLDWGQLSCVWLLSALDYCCWVFVKDTNTVVRPTLIGFDPALLSKQCCCVLSVSTMITIWGRENTDNSTSRFFMVPNSDLIECASGVSDQMRLVWWMNPSTSHNTVLWCPMECVGVTKKKQFHCWPDIRTELLGANLLSQPPSTSSRLGEPEQLGGWVHVIWITSFLNKEALFPSEPQFLA